MRVGRIVVALAVILAACSGTTENGGAASGETQDPVSTTQQSTTTTTGATTTTGVPTTTGTAEPATTSSTPDTTTSPSAEQSSVLVFYRTAGFTHRSIPAGIDALGELGAEYGFDTTPSDDPSVFTDAGLSGFDVIVFLNTTGDVLGDAQQEAMEGFVASGKGFVGVHSAADTEYEWAWYGGLVGAYFARHPAPQSGSVQVVTPGHPAMEGIPQSFERVEEWYDFRSLPGPEVTVLATVDESSYEGGGMGDPHPIVWAQEYGGGRSFYTGFGHADEAFTDPVTRQILLNGILWAAGRS